MSQKTYDAPIIKKSIIRYTLLASYDDQPDEHGNDPKHLAKAKAYLQTLQQQDPKLYRDTKRFFVVPRKTKQSDSREGKNR